MKKCALIILFVLTIIGGAFAQEEFIYNDNGKRDPFWPLMNSSGNMISYAKEDLMLADLVLEGIVAGRDGNNVAIINGAIVEINGKVGLFIVMEINLDNVVLKRGDETFILRLKKED